MSKNNPKKFDRAELERKLSRREVIKNAASGALIIAIGGGLYKVSSDLIISNAFAEKRPDGKARLPPGQKVIEALKPMGGQPYTCLLYTSPSPRDATLSRMPSSA